MRKFLTMTFAALALAMAAPLTASASPSSPMQDVAGKTPVVDVQPKAGSDLNNCYCRRIYYRT